MGRERGEGSTNTNQRSPRNRIPSEEIHQTGGKRVEKGGAGTQLATLLLQKHGSSFYLIINHVFSCIMSVNNFQQLTWDVGSVYLANCANFFVAVCF